MDVKPLSMFATSTSVVRDNKIERSIRADLKAQRAVILSCPILAAAGLGEVSWTNRVGVTELFMNHYEWSFPKNSVVFINAPYSKVLENAVLSRGANTFMGWETVPATPQQLAVGKDLMHLFVGTDWRKGSKNTIPEQPPLRNIGLREAVEYLAGEGLLSVSPDAGGQISFHISAPRNGEIVNQIRPTIEFVGVDEKLEQVYVRGQLGEASTEKKIWISGTLPPLTGILETADGRIAGKDLLTAQWGAKLSNAFLAGSFGGGWVQVKDGNRWSNAVPLTRIDSVLQLNLASAGNLKIDITFAVTIRGMLQGYRLLPNDNPRDQGFIVRMANSLDMVANWTASGSATETEGNITTTLTWSGSGQVSARLEDPGLSVSFASTFDTKRLVGSLGLDLTDDRGFIETRVVTTSNGTTTSETVIPLSISTKPEWRDPAGAQEPIRLHPEFLVPEPGSETYSSTDYSRFSNMSVVTVTWSAGSTGPHPEERRGQR